MFYWYFNSDKLHGPFEEFGDLAEHVVADSEDSRVFQQRVTPDLVVARYNWDMPISECPTTDVVTELAETVYDKAPIEEWARESVLAEREVCMEMDDDPWGPGDNTPLDSDRHNEELTQWQNRRVNYDAFAAIDAELIIDQCYTATLDDLEQRIMELWDSGYGTDEVSGE